MNYVEELKKRFEGIIKNSEDMLQLAASVELVLYNQKENSDSILLKSLDSEFNLKEIFLSELETTRRSEKLIIDLIQKNLPFILSGFDNSMFREFLRMSNYILNTNESIFDYMMTNVNNEHRKSLYFTSPSLNQLILRILDIQSEDSVLNPTVGYGDIMMDILKRNKEQTIVVQETNQLVYELMQIRFYLNSVTNTEVFNGDILNECMYVENNEIRTFDKVISQPPFGISLSRGFENQDKYNRFPFGNIPRSNADWAYISNGIVSLNDQGKGVFIAPLGVCFRGGSEKKIREKILSLDLIESVIQLPAGVFYPETSIPIVVLIINKKKETNNQGKIQLINMSASELKKVDMRNQLMNETIDEIMTLLTTKNEEKTKSTILNVKDLSEANILPDKYLYKSEIYIEDLGKFSFNLDVFSNVETVKIKDIAKISRGLTTTVKDEHEAGDIKIIKISDIHDGKLNYDKLSSIYREKVTSEKYFVQKNDLIISNRGNTFKTTVIEKEVKDVIFSQNFVNIRLTNDGFSPRWIELFLDSPVGKGYLDVNAEGSAVRILSTNAISEMEIPKLPLEKQLQIIQHYQMKKEEIQSQITKLEKELVTLKLDTYESMGLKNTFEKLDS
ncbi:N-6 DNA methylase [Enterococcus sp. DIV0242_7C1]|uniref:site-specific DNA-methyltransferase (adenine-specific) n=1 Tax=Candidatus Enterococcus dunnyi TaxID=1834192 RepID=A0AAQ3W5D4_9ENTE|nr:N-6 DNA methylase [Enterococcus sp. DIV0242_7C1]